MKLVLVEWVDSFGQQGWHRDVVPTEPLLVRSVGWVVYRNDKVLVVASHIAVEDEPQRTGELCIPVCAVKRIRSLHEPT